MKSTIVTVAPGKRVRLAKIDPGATGHYKKEAAAARLAEIHREMELLQEALYAERRQSLLLVFQAMDTGGKDGTVKALCSGLNPAGVQVTSFKVPSQEELDHDFLWRVHKVAPLKGMIGIWNRSHYEDVLVTRVHKLVKKKVWEERYKEINAFEKILTQTGTTVLKFMLHISQEEQKKRLQARIDDPEKRWKFNPNDLKERAHWDEYQEAYEDAVNCCSTKYAPWHIVPADAKWARNLAVAELVLKTLKKMDPQYPKLAFDLKDVAID